MGYMKLLFSIFTLILITSFSGCVGENNYQNNEVKEYPPELTILAYMNAYNNGNFEGCYHLIYNPPNDYSTFHNTLYAYWSSNIYFYDCKVISKSVGSNSATFNLKIYISYGGYITTKEKTVSLIKSNGVWLLNNPIYPA